MTEENDGVVESAETLALAYVLETMPPNQTFHVDDLACSGSYNSMQIETPEIQLHCSNNICNGTRIFRCQRKSIPNLVVENFEFGYLTYRCSNCTVEKKVFSIAAKLSEEQSKNGICYKFGELPNFGPPTPARLITLIGPDREEFLKGRRCENQGLGVGAFIYYRRVVENQKNRILEQIIKVSQKIGAAPEKITVLEKALTETQFSRAMSDAKDSIPESLLINGHSPLLLLHSALSEGVHAMTDQDCLNIAGSVRIVLVELSEKLSQALKDEAELGKALNVLINKK